MAERVQVMGMYTVQEFVYYFMEDIVGAPFTFAGLTMTKVAQATGMFTLCVLLGAVVASVPAGTNEI